MTFTISQRNDALKLIALITMFIDHLGMLFYTEYTWMRTIGRLAFPIFAYQLALGFVYTRSRSKYAVRLLAFAALAQLPYSFFNQSLYFYPYGLNIIFTLFYAFLVLNVIEKADALLSKPKKEQRLHAYLKGSGLLFITLVMLILPDWIAFHTPVHMEYGSIGVCFVVLFYALRGKPIRLLVGYALLSFVSTYYGLAKSSYYHAPQLYTFWSAMLDYKNALRIAAESGTQLFLLSGRLFQARSIFALPVIFALEYWQAKGYIQFKLNRYVAYWFYPVHMALLIGALLIQSMLVSALLQ